MKLSQFRFLLLPCVLAMGAVLLSATEYYGTRLSVPDSIRARMEVEKVMDLPLNELRRQPVRREVENGDSAPRVSFVLGLGGTGPLEFRFLFRGREGYSERTPGSMVLRRPRGGTGIESASLVLRSSPRIAMEMTATGISTRVSVSFEQDGSRGWLYRDIPVKVPLARLLKFPLADLMDVCSRNLDWGLLLGVPDNGYYQPVAYMVTEIDGYMGKLPDAEDGALDGDGTWRRIDGSTFPGKPGFNCSGFVKWITDGLYRGLHKDDDGNPGPGLLSIDDLKIRQYDDRGNSDYLPHEESRDPFFGLDWTRNIAARLQEDRTGRKPENSQDCDVRQPGFVQYVEDKGFFGNDLAMVFYLLAQKEPGYFYLVSVNGEYGNNPVLWQHHHVLAAFPRMDPDGTFRLDLFSRNSRISLAGLLRTWPRCQFHLVRVRASKDFYPPAVP